MEVKMVRSTYSWYCECCGGITDTNLTVEVEGTVIGEYADDDHFGYSRIDDLEVEKDIAQAVGAETEYAALCARRKDLELALEGTLMVAQTEQEEDAAYAAHLAGYEEFSAWLTALGHELVEETHAERSEYYDYPSVEDEEDPENEGEAVEYPGSRYEAEYSEV